MATKNHRPPSDHGRFTQESFSSGEPLSSRGGTVLKVAAITPDFKQEADPLDQLRLQLDSYAAMALLAAAQTEEDLRFGILGSALALGWEVFRTFLIDELFSYVDGALYIDGALDDDRRKVLVPLRDDDYRRSSRDFEHLCKRIAGSLDVPTSTLPRWNEVLLVEALRHAIIHNRGFYTSGLVKKPDVALPESVFSDGHPTPESLVDRRRVLLTIDSVIGHLEALRETAEELRRRIGVRPASWLIG
jgi:hypothetical protein